MAEARVERRLAAILAADVAGYSRLMGVDEEGTLAALKAYRRELVDPKIAEHRGRIVKTTGDGALVEFASAVDAVRCAMEIQRAVTERSAEVPEDRRIEFRIGINVGDIIIDEGDIYGDGVNIASRVETLASPGAICLSDNAYQQIKGKLSLDVADLGEQQLKNIAQTVRVYSVRPHGASARPALSLPDKPSIAVLPFQNMSGDPEQEYFADGMVEDIITGLSRIKWLFVIARNSGFAYKGKSIDVKQVGRELGVRYVLEGSVRRAVNRVRITCQLIEAQTGAHLWAERYDRPLDDIFAIQDEITLSVVGAIEPSLRQAEIERTKRKRPDSLDAYDLVLRALPHAYTAMPEGAAKAIPLIERALALEPDYPFAHGIAAWGHHILFNRAGMREEDRRSAIHHAHEAITHGRDDAMALTLGGFVVSMVEHDRAAAVEAFEAALGVSPSAAFTYFFGSCALGLAGEAERPIDWGERGLRLSPYDPLTFLPWLGISLGHFQRGRYAKAIDAARRSIQSNPHLSTTHAVFAAALAKSGRIDEARAAMTRALALQPKLTIGGMCAAFGIPPSLATPLSEALHTSGLPQ
jgi:adenylate cyclase